MAFNVEVGLQFAKRCSLLVSKINGIWAEVFILNVACTRSYRKCWCREGFTAQLF